MNSASVSKPEMGEEVVGDFDVLVCRSGHRRFALKVRDVIEVVRMVAIAPIPDSLTWMAGLIDYRGRIAPVIDLANRIGTGSRRDDPNARIVICSGEHGPFGLIVDEVEEVATISSASVWTSEVISEKDKLVADAVRMNNRLVLMLDTSILGGGLIGPEDAAADVVEGSS